MIVKPEEEWMSTSSVVTALELPMV